MAYYTFIPIEPQDAFTAASVTTPLNALKDGYNDIQETGMREGALGPYHIPSLLPTADINLKAEKVSVGADHVSVHTSQDGAAKKTYSGVRLTTEYPHLTDSAWERVEGAASHDSPCEFNFDALVPTNPLAGEFVGAMVVLANCQFLRINRNASGSYKKPEFVFGAFCIQYYVGGAWKVWPSSVRYVSEKRIPHQTYLPRATNGIASSTPGLPALRGDIPYAVSTIGHKLQADGPAVLVTFQQLHNTNAKTYSHIDVSIRTVFDPTTIDDSGTITKIRFACATYEKTFDASGGGGSPQYNTHEMDIAGANMTVLPLHIKDMGSGI